MANRQIKPEVKEPTYLVKAKSIFRTEILERIKKGNDILKKIIKTWDDFNAIKKEYSSWHDYNLELLKQSFNEPYNEYRKSYDDEGSWGALFREERESLKEEVKEFIDNFNKKVENLNKLEQKVDLLKYSEPDVIIQQKGNIKLNMSQVFIVHGQDESAELAVARFIENLGFDAIILHEQVNSGKTIIEKIEEFSNVGFGVVLYTPCDLGAKKGEEANLQPRARQNVVFEHGFLIAKLGRRNVCALVKDKVEIPNDISGVVYVPMDDYRAWEIALAKELRDSGYNVDLNQVF